MKRSEMLDIIKRQLEIELMGEDRIDDESMAILLLDTIEQAGMLPPLNTDPYDGDTNTGGQTDYTPVAYLKWDDADEET